MCSHGTQLSYRCSHQDIMQSGHFCEDESQATDYSSSEERSQMEIKSGAIAPIFLQSLEDMELEEGEDLEIKCQIMGAPIPDIACHFTRDVAHKSASIKKIKSDYINYNNENGICRVSLKLLPRSTTGRSI